MKQSDEIKDSLIGIGVKKLKLFGFINVTTENIMSDEVYSLYFKRILQSMLGKRQADDATINELISLLKLKSGKSPGV